MILLLLALAALAGSGLQQAGASRTALALVVDARNQPFVDVGLDDFVIKEGAEAREVLSVRMADYPVVVLVDTGGDQRGDFQQLRKAVGRFVERLGHRPVAIGTLGDPPTMITSFDDERRQLAERLEALRAVPTAESLPLQATAGAAQTLRDLGAPFSAIVVVSANTVDASRKSLAEMIGPIVESGAIIHVVANRYDAGAGVAGPGESLRSVAQTTQGEYTTIYSSASYQAALDHLADRLAKELMIEYIVPAGSKGNDVQIGVRLPGARVRGLGVRPRE